MISLDTCRQALLSSVGSQLIHTVVPFSVTLAPLSALECPLVVHLNTKCPKDSNSVVHFYSLPHKPSLHYHSSQVSKVEMSQGAAIITDSLSSSFDLMKETTDQIPSFLRQCGDQYSGTRAVSSQIGLLPRSAGKSPCVSGPGRPLP